MTFVSVGIPLPEFWTTVLDLMRLLTEAYGTSLTMLKITVVALAKDHPERVSRVRVARGRQLTLIC